MYFLFENKRIHYSDDGKGSVVVLLHGYLESSEVWNGFEESLTLRFRVIAVDLPGHGLSEVYGQTHTMEFMATAVKELLKSLQIDKVFLVGHSLGGYVALAFLEFFTEYLSGYCLFHSQPLSDTKDIVEKRMREIAIVNAGKKDLMYPDNIHRMFAPSNLKNYSKALQRSMDIASRLPADGIISMLNGMIVRPSRLSVMEEGRVPCLWILGLMDNYIPCDIIQSKVKLPSNARVIIFENSGHLGFVEEEGKAVLAVTRFIKEFSG